MGRGLIDFLNSLKLCANSFFSSETDLRRGPWLNSGLLVVFFMYFVNECHHCVILMTTENNLL